jgi:hypothetical protein
MPQVDRLEASEVAALVERALAAPTFEAALPRWRMVFVERLDFRPATGTLRLTSAGLPTTATRVAERDGVQVVALALPDDGRVTAMEIRAALKDVRATLNGDLLLIVTNAARSEWHLVYPAPAAGREALRRLILRPGELRRTAISQLTGVYDSLQRGVDIRMALERGYDVEAVAREFYERYKQVFNQVEQAITGFSAADLPRRVAPVGMLCWRPGEQTR